MSFCVKCGSELDPGSAFCESCGAPATGSAAAPEQTSPAPPPATPPGVPPAAGAPVYAPPGAPGPMPLQPSKGGGGGKVILLVVLGIVVVGIVVVLLLGFAVGPKFFTSSSGGSSGGPEDVVNSYFNAMEKGDIKGWIALIDPATAKQLEKELEGYGYGSLEELLQEMYVDSFPEEDLKITGLKYKSSINGDKATVEVVDGTATYTDYYGDEVTETVDDMENVFSETQFNLKKIDGKWYLEPEL
jgi:hypothetical protein